MAYPRGGRGSFGSTDDAGYAAVSADHFLPAVGLRRRAATVWLRHGNRPTIAASKGRMTLL